MTHTYLRLYGTLAICEIEASNFTNNSKCVTRPEFLNVYHYIVRCGESPGVPIQPNLSHINANIVYLYFSESDDTLKDLASSLKGFPEFIRANNSYFVIVEWSRILGLAQTRYVVSISN